MPTIILFHSALGLRPSIKTFANALEEAGFTVLTPDLYGGKVFDDYSKGNEFWFSTSIPNLLQKASELAATISGDIIFAGFSNGAAIAEYMAATHPQAKGALLMHGALPLEALQVPEWPGSLPVQLHYNTNDPFRNTEGEDAFKKAVKTSGAPFTEYLYEGNTHLFADADLPDYVKASADKMLERAITFCKEAV